jgi:hypothetical protein
MKRKQPQREDSTPNTKLDADIMVDKQLFTDAGLPELMVVALGETGATREQVYWFIQQCERMKVEALFLETLLSGMVNVSNISKTTFRLPEELLPCCSGPANRGKRPDLLAKCLFPAWLRGIASGDA